MKQEEIISFLESGALESFLLGMCSENEAMSIEQLIQNHPEVRKAYDELQAEVEQFSNQFSKSAPQNSKEDVLSQIDQFMATSRETNAPLSSGNSRFRISNVAAAAAILIIGSYATYMTIQFNAAASHNAHLVERAVELENQVKSQQKTITEVEGLTSIVVTPNTQKVILKGKVATEELVVQAFWNNQQEKALLHASNLPDLPQDKCYQLWADVDGEMVSVAVLAESDVPVEAHFLGNASSLNITIEPAGGNDHATVATLVASITLGA
ncbi:MAG: anti-sigma-K factor RskA [Flavobacteriales bacterium]|jgi:anti-sigma-K factor RskA